MKNDKNNHELFLDYNRNMFSKEAYFGQNAPLAMILDTYCEELIQFFKGPTNSLPNFKDKKILEQLEDICTRFGKALAAELNMEEIKIGIDASLKLNACAYPMYFYCDGMSVKQDGKSKKKYIDIDKYIDLEEIVQTNTGYKFKNSKGKIGCIICNVGTIKSVNTARDLSAILCHEIGHMMQHGVFGTMKCYADVLTSRDLLIMRYRLPRFSFTQTSLFLTDKKEMAKSNWLHTFLRLVYWFFLDGGFNIAFSIPIVLFCYLFSFIFWPNILDVGIFAGLNKHVKDKLGRMSDETKHKLKDHLDEIENGDPKEKSKIYNNWSALKQYTKQSPKERAKIFDSTLKSLKPGLKELPEYDETINVSDEELENKIKKNIAIGLLRQIVPIADMVYGIEYNILDLLTLSHYSKHYINKSFFLRKYENFADIFSSAYGYGLEMVKFHHNMEKSNLDRIDELYDHSLLFKIPLLGVIGKSIKYNEMRDGSLLDCHGTNDQRIQAIYTAYVHEVETNVDLTPKQKAELLKSIEIIKTADDEFYDSVKHNGFFMKYYNKLIDHRIQGIDKEIEEKVLAPMEDVCKELNAKKKKE